ncbi:MAG: type VI secretion system protein TssA [Phycisphaerae bacterium]
MPSFDESGIIDLGKNPIPGAEPCGIDAADDEEYLAVGAEMSKVGRIEADEPDWYVIEQSGTNILRSKSKDVEMAASLGHALFKRYSYAGLSATLALLTELVKNFWDGCFPPRPRRRKARIEALANRFTEQRWFQDNQPKPDDFDALDACVVRVEELKSAFTEKMPDEPPDFGKFVRGLKEHAGKRPKPAASPAPAESGAPTTAPAAGGATFAAGEVADASGALNAILAASTFLRKADVMDPIPYAVTRVLKWSKVSLPESDAGKYEIEPPEASLVDALAHQLSNSVWEHLLKNAESAFRSNDPLWLDLQRYVCAAMTGLGPTYDKARAAVTAQTAGLVNRLGDGLFELRFRNGTPLCSGETKMWLESEVAPARSAGGAAGAGDGALTEASEKARKLAGSGKLKEALTKLHEGLSTCTQRRDRFLWRLRTAQLCYEAQRLQLAAPLLEECHEEIRRYHIDEWEPTLAVDVAQTLYRCRKSLTTSEKAPAQEALQGVRDSFAWLCQLDPLAALAAEPSGK